MIENSKLTVKAIVAHDLDQGIGRNGIMPWHLIEDLKMFSKLTKDNIVLMGKSTWDSLAQYNMQPLPNRLNIVCSKNNVDELFAQKIMHVSNDAVSTVELYKKGMLGDQYKSLWIIGGSQIYKDTLDLVDELYVTEINKKYTCDVFFPEYKNKFNLMSKTTFPMTTETPQYSFAIYRNNNFIDSEIESN